MPTRLWRPRLLACSQLAVQYRSRKKPYSTREIVPVKYCAGASHYCKVLDSGREAERSPVCIIGLEMWTMKPHQDVRDHQAIHMMRVATKISKLDLNHGPQMMQKRTRTSLIQSISNKSLCGWAAWLSSIGVWGDPASGSEMSVSQGIVNHGCVSSTCMLYVVLRLIRTCLHAGQSQTYFGA